MDAETVTQKAIKEYEADPLNTLRRVYAAGYDRGRWDRKGRPVLQYDMAGKFIQEFTSITNACEVTGANHSCVGKVCNGERKAASGYQWRYK